MVTCFLFSSALVFLPAYLISLRQVPRCGGLIQRLSLNVSMHFALMATFAALSFGIPNGWLRLISIVGLSTWGTSLITSKFFFRESREPKGRLLLWIVAALLVMADLFLIYHESGWSFQREAWFWNGVSYFRPPFPHDIQRDVAIVNALVRGAGSPYLPDSGFAYQLLWYHWAAPIVALFTGISSYPFVAGCILTTALVFFFVLLTSLSAVRPTWLKNPLAIAVAFIFLLHTDWYSAGRLLSLGQELGIETDLPSRYPLFFRPVSLKNLTLIAPQHALFMVFLIQFLFIRKWLSQKKRETLLAWEIAFGSLCWMLSPVLAAFVLPSIVLVECIRKKGFEAIAYSLKKHAVIAVLGLVGYFIVLRSSPILLLTRPEEGKLFFPLEWKEWIRFVPLTWAVVLGLPGLLFSLLLVFRRKMTLRLSPEFIFVVGFLIFYQFFYGHGEIRRYVSLTACALLPFILLRALPLHLPRSFSLVRVGMPAILFVGILLHYVFLKSFLLMPSVLDQAIPWKDYLALNQLIRIERPNARVVGAFGIEVGTEKTTLMEVVPSSADPVEVAIHTELSPEKFNLLRKAGQSARSLPYALGLGYDSIAWGPIEERLWGVNEKKRFIGDAAKPLIVSGAVAVYRLRDLWRERLQSEPLVGSSAAALLFAEWAQEMGWYYEAADELFRVLPLDKNNPLVHRGLAKSLGGLGFRDQAEHHQQKSLGLP